MRATPMTDLLLSATLEKDRHRDTVLVESRDGDCIGYHRSNGDCIGYHRLGLYALADEVRALRAELAAAKAGRVRKAVAQASAPESI